MANIREITIGTTNRAKTDQLIYALENSPILLRRLPEQFTSISVVEDAPTIEGNARKKALFYAQLTGETVVSMDNSLHIDGIADDEQPGVRVRRLGQTEQSASDEELLTHYHSLVRRIGHPTTAHWHIALCLAHNQNVLRETVIESHRLITEQISPARIPGYPHESMQIDLSTGKFIAAMTIEEQKNFWKRELRTPLLEFFKDVRND
jgi:inosine/xanthosine triphosphate pyrophosphatase family protein